jgi:hypothetical protein
VDPVTGARHREGLLKTISPDCKGELDDSDGPTVPVSAVPGLTIVALAVSVLVVANALAVIPAVTLARRRSVGQLLRAQ